MASPRPQTPPTALKQLPHQDTPRPQRTSSLTVSKDPTVSGDIDSHLHDEISRLAIAESDRTERWRRDQIEAKVQVEAETEVEAEGEAGTSGYESGAEETGEDEEKEKEERDEDFEGDRGWVDRRGAPEGCLFVASLSSQRTDEQLHNSVATHFTQWGPLLNVKVLKDWLARPYAFVQFENITDAKQALVEAHNTVIDGRHIRVEQARVNRTLFIGKFGRNLTEQDLREMLGKYGPIEDITILLNHTGKSKGCGFVKYRYRDDAIRAYLSLRSPQNPQTPKWLVEWASNLEMRKQEEAAERITDPHSVFVGQLNPDAITQELLEERFGVYGKIESACLVNRGGAKSAFGFIKYKDIESADRAIIEENNSVFLERSIRVSHRETVDRVARPPNQFIFTQAGQLQMAGSGHPPHPPGVGYPAAAAQLVAAQTAIAAAQGVYSSPLQPLQPRSRTTSSSTPVMTPSAAAIAAVAQAAAHVGSSSSTAPSPAYPPTRPFSGQEGRRFSMPPSVASAQTQPGMNDPAILAAGATMNLNPLSMNPDPTGAYAGGIPSAETPFKSQQQPYPVHCGATTYGGPTQGGPSYQMNVPSPGGYYPPGPSQSSTDHYTPYHNPYGPVPYGPGGYTSFGAGQQQQQQQQQQQPSSTSGHPAYMNPGPYYSGSSDNNPYYDPYGVGSGGPYGSFGPGGVWYPHTPAAYCGANPYASWAPRGGYQTSPDSPSDASSESGLGTPNYEQDQPSKTSSVTSFTNNTASVATSSTQAKSRQPLPSQQAPSIQAQGAQLAASGIASFGPNVLASGGNQKSSSVDDAASEADEHDAGGDIALAE